MIAALKRVPFSTPRNLYEAIVAWNFVFYIDLGDNVGNLEQGLMPYYNGEDVTELLREYFINVGSDDGWSCRIGPEETPLSKQIIQVAKGLSRPMVELCINEDTSDSLWECACKSIAQGNANPSLYHYDLYMKCMRERFPEIPEEDLQRFCGCGPFGGRFLPRWMVKSPIWDRDSCYPQYSLLPMSPRENMWMLPRIRSFRAFYFIKLLQTRKSAYKTNSFFSRHALWAFV